MSAKFQRNRYSEESLKNNNDMFGDRFYGLQVNSAMDSSKLDMSMEDIKRVSKFICKILLIIARLVIYLLYYSIL